MVVIERIVYLPQFYTFLKQIFGYAVDMLALQ